MITIERVTIMRIDKDSNTTRKLKSFKSEEEVDVARKKIIDLLESEIFGTGKEDGIRCDFMKIEK
jgi:hypothetical protein